MSRYKAYPEYRDSGSDWFDSIPAHWDVKRISYISQLRSGDSIVSDHIEAEGDYPVYGGNGLRGYASSFNLDGEFILIGRQGALCGNINYGSGKFWASEHAVVVYPSLDVNIKWLGETLRAMNLNQYNVSAAQPGLAVANIACLKIPFPPRKQQDSIAAFLDHEIAKIDALIERQQRLIELLKEKRQAVISHAVTKGLDPNAPLKDSGVEWADTVPAHWRVSKLSYHASVSNGATPSRDNLLFWENGTIGWLNSSKVNDEVIEEADQFITELAFLKTSVKPVEKGDLVMAITGEGQTRGRVAICNISATINQHLAAISIYDSRLNYQFLCLWLEGNYERIRYESEGAGSTKGAITCSEIGAFPVVVPPAEEQDAIIDYVNKRKREFDRLVHKAISAIELMQERRTALISAAVTGKIDVRDWQPAAA